jgi:hypothetical protein
VDKYLSVVSYLITFMYLYLYKIMHKPNFMFKDIIRDRRVVYINNLAMNRNTVTHLCKYTGLGQGLRGYL